MSAKENQLQANCVTSAALRIEMATARSKITRASYLHNQVTGVTGKPYGSHHLVCIRAFGLLGCLFLTIPKGSTITKLYTAKNSMR
jgi:hypothetical protein